MVIKQERFENYAIITAEGRLEVNYFDEFKIIIDELVAAGLKNIIIDCKDLFFISSAGLRVIIMTLKEMQKVQGRLMFAALHDNIRSVFVITGYAQLLEIYETTEDAVQSIQN